MPTRPLFGQVARKENTSSENSPGCGNAKSHLFRAKGSFWETRFIYMRLMCQVIFPQWRISFIFSENHFLFFSENNILFSQKTIDCPIGLVARLVRTAPDWGLPDWPDWALCPIGHNSARLDLARLPPDWHKVRSIWAQMHPCGIGYGFDPYGPWRIWTHGVSIPQITL